jgi:hypothetical protein
VERGFEPRLRKRLKEGGVLVPVNDAPLSCRVALSEEGGLVWAVAVLEGVGIVAPSTVAQSHAVDRELEVAIGAALKPQQTRFVLERLGPLPHVVLDAALVDIDGDTVDEIAVLSVDGLRFFRSGASGNGRLERTGAVVPLQRDRRWPRIAVGWLAVVDAQTLWVTTSAGHSLLVDPRTGRTSAGPVDLVPFRGAPGPQGPLCGGWRLGSPVVALPLMTMQRKVVRALSLPARVRDLASVPGLPDAWIVVDESGALIGQVGNAPSTSLAAERVGDRVVVSDLDSDGSLDVLTTSASAPGDTDHVVLRRLDPDLATSSVVFRSPLSGGSIAALAVGHLDYDARADAVLVEEVGGETVIWRLRHTP